MITTKIEVPPHLKEYLIGKFCNMQDSPIRFPDNTDIYHFIYDLLERRPCNVIDHGNLEIILPERSLGKNPKTYNYLGIRSQIILVRKIDRMLWAEAHDFLDEQKHTYGITYINAIHNFMTMYGIDQSQRMHSKRTITGGEPKFAGKRKKEVIIAQKNSRASVVNVLFLIEKMFEKRLKNAY